MNFMFRGGGQGQWRQWLQGIIQKFREKGAISPEKAMTVQELDLPPRFEQAMHRRLGQTGIFVELNGKYYLNEDRLKQIKNSSVKWGLEVAGLVEAVRQAGCVMVVVANGTHRHNSCSYIVFLVLLGVVSWFPWGAFDYRFDRVNCIVRGPILSGNQEDTGKDAAQNKHPKGNPKYCRHSTTRKRW